MNLVQSYEKFSLLPELRLCHPILPTNSCIQLHYYPRHQNYTMAQWRAVGLCQKTYHKNRASETAIQEYNISESNCSLSSSTCKTSSQLASEISTLHRKQIFTYSISFHSSSCELCSQTTGDRCLWLLPFRGQPEMTRMTCVQLSFLMERTTHSRPELSYLTAIHFRSACVLKFISRSLHRVLEGLQSHFTRVITEKRDNFCLRLLPLTKFPHTNR